MIKFTTISDRLPYPPAIKGRLSSMHSDIIAYVSTHYDGTASYRQNVVNVMNTLSYLMISGDSMPVNYKSSDPLNIAVVDDDISKPVIGKLHLHSRSIDWDIEPSIQSDAKPVETVKSISYSDPEPKMSDVIKTVRPTPKDDLYLKPPIIAQFDFNKPYMQKMIGMDMYTIYTSIPEIPTKQNEISVTTNVDRMSYEDVMKLYPNQLIRTRSSALYEHIDGIDYDDRLGLILPVKGFTKKQIIDNIIRYPHIYKISKIVDGEIVSFYTTIEIDGKLHKTLDVWDSLPEAKLIPKSSEFIKEYVIRRYLLERDVKKLNHAYPMYGKLSEFLTLFAPADEYIQMGYKNVAEIAKQCVKSRVEYKQSRNPVLRRLLDE